MGLRKLWETNSGCVGLLRELLCRQVNGFTKD